MTESAALPVQPFRTTLYDPDELLGGFDPDDATSWATTQWTQRLPVWPVLEALFDDHTMLHLTDDVDDAVAFVASHPPVPLPPTG